MYKEEVNKQIDELKKQIAALEQKLKTLPAERWHPKYGEIYYFHNSTGMITSAKWGDYTIDYQRLELGQIFKIEKDAEFNVEKLKVLAELKDYAEKNPVWDGATKHWALIYSCIQGVQSLCYTVCPSPIVFESEEVAEAAIEAIGEARIKKYYFEIKKNEEEEIPF